MRLKKKQEKFKYLGFLEIAWNTEQLKKGTINLLGNNYNELEIWHCWLYKVQDASFPNHIYHTKLILIVKYLRL